MEWKESSELNVIQPVRSEIRREFLPVEGRRVDESFRPATLCLAMNVKHKEEHRCQFIIMRRYE